MDCFRAFVIYSEDSPDMSLPRYHRNVRRYAWRHRYWCGDPWNDLDALIMFSLYSTLAFTISLV